MALRVIVAPEAVSVGATQVAEARVLSPLLTWETPEEPDEHPLAVCAVESPETADKVPVEDVVEYKKKPLKGVEVELSRR